jgi:hypothetical protein
MLQPHDPVIVAALEYESATLAALRALDGGDREALVAACLRWADAVAAIDAMPAQESDRAAGWLAQRGRVPHHARRLLEAAMEGLAAQQLPGDRAD